MIKQNVLAIALTIAFVVSGVRGERWSRQVTNSEWIPLAAPRTDSQVQGQEQNLETEGVNGLITAADRHSLSRVQPIALPPELQQQYQDQLLQLQRTQESIEKLLHLQQQLKDQQRLLKTDGYLPRQQVAQSTSEDLVPPAPASEALPPIYAAQTFRDKGASAEDYRESSSETEGQEEAQPVSRFKYVNAKHGTHYQVVKHQTEPLANNDRNYSPSTQNNHRDAEDEEVQLVYVPAETLSQRGQLKLHAGRVRKPGQQLQYRPQQQYHKEVQDSPSPNRPSLHQDTFTHAFLQHLQREQDENTDLFRDDRLKALTLSEHQKEVDKQTKLHQEAVLREQELKRQRDEEKAKKDLEAVEELARQRELQRLRQVREKQKIEAEKRRLEEERKRREETEKLEEPKGHGSELSINQKPHASPLVREHNKQQLHSDVTKPTNRLRSRLRQKPQRPNYAEEQAPVLQPNQPPLAIYMDSTISKSRKPKVTDALKLLKHAKTIAVLDTVEPNAPRVFVGPSSLDPPPKYVKFNLPYLSSLDNRVERRVESLPFFVAPLSFEPPLGYSKIPFPAPHIGSVVVNTLTADQQSENSFQDQNESPPSRQSLEEERLPVTTGYVEEATIVYAPEIVTTQKPTIRNQSPRPRVRPYRVDDKTRVDERTRLYESGRMEEKRLPTVSFQEERNYDRVEKPVKVRQYESTPSYGSDSTQTYPSVSDVTHRYYERTVPVSEFSDYEKQGNKDYEKHVEVKDRDRYRLPEQQRQHYTVVPSNHQMNVDYREQTRDDGSSVIGSTQYSLPAELPAISPHLPGLVNALIEKNEAAAITLTTTEPTTTTTTTTTTTEAPTTRARTRGRQRGRVTTRPTTSTYSSATRSIGSDRSRRPYNRSRTRVTTTTTTTTEPSKDYYDPTKAKYEETTARYEPETRRRNPYRIKPTKAQETESKAAQAVTKNRNTESRVIYEPVTHLENTKKNIPTPTVTTVNVPVYSKTEYPPTASEENYPRRVPSTRDPINYPRKTYSPNIQSQPESQYDPSEEAVYNNREKLDDAPVNGFNYEAQTSVPDANDQSYYGRDKEYDQSSSTEASFVEKTKEPEYYTVYAQGQSYEDESNSRPSYYHTGQEGPRTDPIFIPVSQEREDYSRSTSASQEIITQPPTTTTTPEPVIIRQKVRARLGGNQYQQESNVQTKPRGPQDEYVRFSAVNQEPVQTQRPTLRHRQNRPQVVYKSEQADGDEYVRIRAPQYHVPSTTPSIQKEEIEYGFTRVPSFRSTQLPEESYSSSTYRQEQDASYVDAEVTEGDSSPSKVAKSRNEYNVPNRKLEIKIPVTQTPVSKYSYPTSAEEDAYQPKSTEAPLRPKTRGRVRRPGQRRRPSTTTEAGLDVQNELPLDENYPRIIQTIQRPLASPRPAVYEDSYEQSPVSLPVRNVTYQEQSEENPPAQEYILHYAPTGVSDERLAYQAQLPELSPEKVNLRTYQPHLLQSSDIYGAESQWSTKLSRNSFQGSNYPNEVVETAKSSDNENATKKAEEPEIITAGPEVPMTVVVSSQYEKPSEKPSVVSEEQMMSMDFGMKMNAENGQKFNSEVSTEASSSTENVMDNSDAMIRKKGKRKGLRRRVRVRVRPLESFDTAESQNYDNSPNQVSAQSKDQFYTYTTEKVPSSSEPTSTEGSLLSGLIDMMTGNNQAETTVPPFEQTPEVEPTVTVFPETTIIPDVTNFSESSQSVTAQPSTLETTETPATEEVKQMESQDYPQNHRSTWSEVQYESKKSVADFSKYYTKNYQNESSDQEVAKVSNPVVQANETKSLSDYVKVIFDSIKHAQQAEESEPTGEPQKQEPIQQIPPLTTSEQPQTEKVQVKDASEDLSLATMEPVRTSKSTNLSKVLRTTTTTKVSHMTEICYRGKCVMSKPNKEGSAR